MTLQICFFTKEAFVISFCNWQQCRQRPSVTSTFPNVSHVEECVRTCCQSPQRVGLMLFRNADADATDQPAPALWYKQNCNRSLCCDQFARAETLHKLITASARMDVIHITFNYKVPSYNVEDLHVPLKQPIILSPDARFVRENRSLKKTIQREIKPALCFCIATHQMQLSKNWKTNCLHICRAQIQAVECKGNMCVSGNSWCFVFYSQRTAYVAEKPCKEIMQSVERVI